MKKRFTFPILALLLALLSLSIITSPSSEVSVNDMALETDFLCSLGGQDSGHTNY